MLLRANRVDSNLTPESVRHAPHAAVSIVDPILGFQTNGQLGVVRSITRRVRNLLLSLLRFVVPIRFFHADGSSASDDLRDGSETAGTET